MPKYLDYHGLVTLQNDINSVYLRQDKRGVANGVASLNSSGKVPTSQLPDIHNIPSGGSASQVLAKASNTNYDVQWVTPQGGGGGTSDYSDLSNKPQINGVTLTGNKTTVNLGIHEIPSGGNSGQVLAKVTGTDYDLTWVTPDVVITSYDGLSDRPQINGVTLTGNKTSSALGIHDIPSGGASSQVLSKSSATDYSVEWRGIHEIPAGGSSSQVLAKASGTDFDVQWVTPQGGGGGTSDYDDLSDKPQINGVTLSGNKSTSDLGIPTGEDIVVVSDTQPTDPDAMIWLPETAAQSIQVPTYAEHTAVATDVSRICETSSSNVGKVLAPKTVTNGKVTEWQYIDLTTLFTYVVYEYDLPDVAAGATLSITANQLGVSRPTGYKAFAMGKFTSGSVNLATAYANPYTSGDNNMLGIKNTTTSTQSGKTAVMGIVYILTKYCWS